MKKLIGLMMVVGSISQAAQADGFICTDMGENYKVAVYNNTQPKKGTRNAAIMVLSNLNVAHGNKTIATFKKIDGVLRSKELVYTAVVDLRNSNCNRKGEYFMGTRLGYIDEIVLNVDFNYGSKLKHGDEIDGYLTVFKRDGKEIYADMVCSRYLKN